MLTSGAGRRTFGGYVLDSAVGRGASATVYRAHHPADPHRRTLALKVLDEERRTPAARARLAREFDFAHLLDHPHLVTVYAHGAWWLAMRYVGGGGSSELRAPADVLAALAQVADALDYTHRSGIVHGDVKPANILLGADVRGAGAVLVDFGEAHAIVEDVGRRRRHPQVSLAYTAPEVLSGQSPSAASDQYALACTAVELLTGAPPFTADDVADLVAAHLHRRPPPTTRGFDPVARAFDLVVAQALAKLPDLRFPTCVEFVDHLTEVLDPRV